jgi:hypothetical protein
LVGRSAGGCAPRGDVLARRQALVPAASALQSGLIVKRLSRSVVAVNGDPHRSAVIDALMAADDDCDVVYVESMTGAYSRIRQLLPDFVVVLCEIDDAAACQLLSMMKLDRAVAGIPVVTCVGPRVDDDVERFVASMLGEPPTLSQVIPMN